MQGRLSPIYYERIQCFPANHWQNEFILARDIGLDLIEWTLDAEDLYVNPLMNDEGRLEIKNLSRKYGVNVTSLTADFVMQEPFWHFEDYEREYRKQVFIDVCNACYLTSIRTIVVPLVDSSSIRSLSEERDVIEFFFWLTPFLSERGIRIVYESGYTPQELARFIGSLPPGTHGINYDIGNSASLGFNCLEEFAAYGSRITHIHVKDRLLGGTTVPLGQGDVDFNLVLSHFKRTDYSGSFILQTARASNNDHVGAMRQYVKQFFDWYSYA